jgi:hypothetical protein
MPVNQLRIELKQEKRELEQANINASPNICMHSAYLLNKIL